MSSPLPPLRLRLISSRNEALIRASRVLRRAPWPPAMERAARAPPGRARALVGLAFASSFARCIWKWKPSPLALGTPTPVSSSPLAMELHRVLSLLRQPRFSPPLSSLRLNLGRPSQDQRPRVLRTPSRAILLKSPPKILILPSSPRPGRKSRNLCIYLNLFKSCFIYRIATALFWP